MTMKKYRLLKDLPGVNAGAIFILDECEGALFYSNPVHGLYLRGFPDRVPPVFATWFEEIKERWEPKIGESFWTVSWNLSVCTKEWENFPSDIMAMKAGNCFRTREHAESAAKEVRAALDRYHERIGE